MNFQVITAIAALVLGSLAPVALAQTGTDWGTYDWSGMANDWEKALDNDDPSDFTIDADYDYEPDDILAFNLTPDAAKKIRGLGFHVVSREILGYLKLELVKLRPPFGMNSRRALRKLRDADPAGFYGFNPIYRLAGAAAGTGACEGLRCYGQSLIGWGTDSCGLRAKVGIVDSAVDLAAGALAGRYIHYRRLNKKPPTDAETEHGTAVAAMLVGAPASGFQGLVPDAELIAADVFSLDRKGQPFTDAAHLATGLDWVASFQPSAVNISIAGPDGMVLRTAIRRMVKAGIAVIAAAGNQGPRAPPQFPAAYPDVLAVTAVDRDLQVYAKANRGDYVALAAPGVGIWTAGEHGAGVFRDGTSFAAPFTTAAVALLRAVEPALAPASVGARLRQNARDLGPPGVDPIFGAGLVQTPTCPTITASASARMPAAEGLLTMTPASASARMPATRPAP